MKKYKARVKSLKEILENEKIVVEYKEDCIVFSNEKHELKYWNMEMNVFIHKELELKRERDYFVYANRYFFKKEWLEDIREVVDPSTLKVDTKIVYSDECNEDPYICGHFAKVVDRKVFVFRDGKTSWTAHKSDIVPVTNWKLAVED